MDKFIADIQSVGSVDFGAQITKYRYNLHANKNERCCLGLSNTHTHTQHTNKNRHKIVAVDLIQIFRVRTKATYSLRQSMADGLKEMKREKEKSN